MENSCLQFSKCEWNISVGYYEKIEKWLPFCKYWSYGKNVQITDPPKFGSLVFQVLMEMEY